MSVDASDETQEPVESGQPELDLGVVSTGLADVDAALQPLETLPDLSVEQHAGVYDQVLSSLAATMASDASEPSGEAGRDGDRPDRGV